MYKKISNVTFVSDVSDVKVKDNGEMLVPLTNEDAENLIVFSKAYRDGRAGTREEVLVRETVKELLIKASKNLPIGYQLVAWESYTPRTLHEALRKKILTESEMNAISHMTGGAVDVSLADENGNLLEMGTDLNHGSPENKSTLYFEELEDSGAELTAEQKTLLKNRRILFHVMSEAGFINNPLAWFHWDYGNIWWAKAKGDDAFYSSVDF